MDPLNCKWLLIQASAKGEKIIAQGEYLQDAGLLLKALRDRSRREKAGITFRVQTVMEPKPCPAASSKASAKPQPASSGRAGSKTSPSPKTSKRKTASTTKRQRSPASNLSARGSVGSRVEVR